MDIGWLMIAIVFAVLGWLVQSRLQNRFERYSKTPLLRGLSGREIAERMLRENGIFDVRVISISGQLTDHYNPATKTVNLSQGVYHGRSVASAAVAAHECGHAVQHATSYAMLGLRSKLVPAVNIASQALPWLLMLGVLMLSRFPGMLLAAVVAQAAITLFTLVTLPVEFDASKRALAWIESGGIVVRQEYDEARDALKWAAMTYLVAALAAVTQLVYLLMRYAGSRRD